MELSNSLIPFLLFTMTFIYSLSVANRMEVISAILCHNGEPEILDFCLKRKTKNKQSKLCRTSPKILLAGVSPKGDEISAQNIIENESSCQKENGVRESEFISQKKSGVDLENHDPQNLNNIHPKDDEIFQNVEFEKTPQTGAPSQTNGVTKLAPHQVKEDKSGKKARKKRANVISHIRQNSGNF